MSWDDVIADIEEDWIQARQLGRKLSNEAKRRLGLVQDWSIVPGKIWYVDEDGKVEPMFYPDGFGGMQ